MPRMPELGWFRGCAIICMPAMKGFCLHRLVLLEMHLGHLLSLHLPEPLRFQWSALIRLALLTQGPLTLKQNRGVLQMMTTK
jgi:hypothetical protein